MVTLAVALVLASPKIAVSFSGVPVVLDPEVRTNSHGAKLTAALSGVSCESTTVIRNQTESPRTVWIAIPRFALGSASPTFDVTAELGIPDKSGSVAYQSVSVAKAPQVADRIPQPSLDGIGSELDWGSTLQSQPLMFKVNVPAQGTRPIRIRYSTPLGSVAELGNSSSSSGFRGAAYSMATSTSIALLSGSITCGDGLFVPIPQANAGFELGLAGTAFRRANAAPQNLLMRLALFTKRS